VIDADNRTLAMCSAGQTQPIYCRVGNNPALMETEGDNFPLGILSDANYEETRLSLKSGEKIIFYTDGIVEAMNAHKEVFGFERLIEVVQNAQTDPADTLLQTIIDKVTSYVGEAPQHDDLTVIVLEVQ
jgi:sigma-B regulation protein RsbU (phosphoserine phosphatase)